MSKMLIGKQSDFALGSLKKIEVPGKDEVAIANVDGKIYAIRGLCNHQGGPLSEGELEEKVITCPWHGAKWDVTTGKLVEFPMELDDEPSYAVTLEGENVFIEI